jgi:hypothetical protein
MGGADADAERGRRVDRHGGARLGRKPRDRLQLGDLLAHGVDDSPAARERPSPIAACAASTTQNGISNVARYPAVNSTPAMMPMVFCASFAPCIRLKPAAETSWSRRNQPSTRRGDVCWNAQ